ncbi:class I SAM-dependent methyltransferase [Candidatus Protochlamydia phocaeensis]|uniref:class I SAM-dependent methyltransferase n=1 Tax=Candidatus Protochlamydia phocaeensis TaxID=1414722 RepID=UPI001896975D|nr:class I SAM-dependent methyltransferase [Candidatus Protochlamydia phocaeensis]
MHNKAITKDSYQATAQAFALNVADLAPLQSIEKFIQLLPSQAKILDIGCGSGRDAKIFTEKGVKVIGIDFCSELIEIAKATAPLAEFQIMDIEEMAFSDETFEGAWAGCSLLHISKNRFLSVLKTIHAALKEKGCFYLTLKQGCGEGLEKDVRYKNQVEKFWSFFEEKELKDFLQKARFKILAFDLVEKSHSYQSHSSFRVFCQKD